MSKLWKLISELQGLSHRFEINESTLFFLVFFSSKGKTFIVNKGKIFTLKSFSVHLLFII